MVPLFYGQRTAYSEAGGVKGVAVVEPARLVAAFEPADPLGRGAVSKGVGRYIAALPLLEPVVADLAGRVEGLVDVARFHHLSSPIGVMRPQARKAVGLQLRHHREPVVRGLGDLAALGLQLSADPQQVLDVMADLVGNDIRLGKVARGVHLVLQVAVEGKVDVDLTVAGAVKGPHGRLGKTTGRLH